MTVVQPVIQGNNDPLLWWKLNNFCFPVMLRVAKILHLRRKGCKLAKYQKVSTSMGEMDTAKQIVFDHCEKCYFK